LSYFIDFYQIFLDFACQTGFAKSLVQTDFCCYYQQFGQSVFVKNAVVFRLSKNNCSAISKNDDWFLPFFVVIFD
jgi:hypothetical protein